LAFDPQRFTVIQMLESAEPQLEKSWKDDPLAKATLQRSLGVSYSALHRLERGRALLESALATFRARGDEKEVVQTVRALATNAIDSGRIEDAVKLLDEAMQHVRHLGKNARPLDFYVPYELAGVLSSYQDRRLPECRQLLDEAISLAQRDSSIPRTDLAVAMTRRSAMLMQEGKSDEAEATALQALAVGRQEDPGGLWEGVPVYLLMIIRSRRHDFASAAEFARQSYELSVKYTGPDGADSASALMLWARYRAEAGDTAEPVRQIRSVLPIFFKAYPPGNFNRWSSLVAAARVFNKAALFKEAEPYARESLDLVDGQPLPEADSRRAESLWHIGESLLGQRRYREAIAVLHRVEAIYLQLGPAWTGGLHRIQALLRDAQSHVAK
jgi:tetratricopeptide (TPR) repeat protein